MRDINRIDKFLEEVGKQWKKYPDFRFVQMIMNIPFEGDPWFLEEDDFIKILTKYMTKFTGSSDDDNNT